MADAVPQKERNRRAHMLRILSEKKLRQFYSEHIGSKATVLFEQAEEHGVIEGFTENYIRVQLPYQQALSGKLYQVLLKEINGAGLVVPALLEPFAYPLCDRGNRG